MTLYLSRSAFPQAQITNVYNAASRQNLLPRDVVDEGVGDGQYFAFLSEDASFCEAANREIEQQREEIRAARLEEGFSEEEIRGWEFRRLEISASYSPAWTGWQQPGSGGERDGGAQ